MIKIIFLTKKPKTKDVAFVSLAEKEETDIFAAPDGRKSIVVGIGKKKDFNRRKLVIAARKIVAYAKKNNIKKFSINFPNFIFGHLKMNEQEVAEILAVNFEMANFEFVQYKTLPKTGWKFVEEIFVIGDKNKSIKDGFTEGQMIGEAVNDCRVLANIPGGDMTPSFLAAEAVKMAKNTKIKTAILGEKEIKKLKMGGILGVSRGSNERPKLIVLEYKNNGGAKPIVLVGKGVTFDSGGLNIKVENGSKDMHMDMSGGAAVICALVLAAKLKIKKNIVGIIPAVENMPSGASYRPGDILRMMSGKTVEVLNTDAEGRIILADVLTYAQKYNPRLIIDVATLTGAAMSALGQRASAIFSKDEKLISLFRELGEESGDYVWPLPLWDEYSEDIKGTFGDISNIGKSRDGGAITAAMFLYQFVKKSLWIHIDMAPRMTSIEDDFLAKGAAGAPVRLLIKALERI